MVENIVPEEGSRILGRDAQRNNILAARVVAETVKTRESEVGDGTTTTVMLIGKFLESYFFNPNK